MRLPIQYALMGKNRAPSPVAPLKLEQMARLEFFAPDLERFPALGLAYDALRAGGTATAVFNAANEEAVGLFLERKLGYMDIARACAEALSRIAPVSPRTLGDILEADARARACVRSLNL